MRSVTMKEIDALRGECADIQKRVHECRERNGPTGVDCSACRMAAEETATRVIRIERMLFQWWAQGCQEARLDVPALGYTHAPASPGVNGWSVEDFTKPLCRMRLAPGDKMAESPDGDAYITDCPACILALDNERLRVTVEHLNAQQAPPQPRADGLRCAWCNVPFTTTDTVVGAGDGAKSSGEPGARFMHVACYYRQKAARLEGEIESLRREVLGLQGEVQRHENDAAYWHNQHRLAQRDVVTLTEQKGKLMEVNAGLISRLDRIAGIALGEEKK